jgi:hypothetical protein
MEDTSERPNSWVSLGAPYAIRKKRMRALAASTLSEISAISGLLAMPDIDISSIPLLIAPIGLIKS